MRIDILTLFPEMCFSVLRESITGRAIERGLVEIYCRNIRDFTDDKHGRVDAAPYGGGSGMILRAQPVYECFEALCRETGRRPHLVYLSPQGETFTQKHASRLAGMENLALLCGHYEGIDRRVIDEIADEELSAGDYVLTGGELPALMIADAVTRLLPGVLAGEEAFTKESHFDSLLEHAQYTRPAVWHGREVPAVLLEGNHEAVEAWRRRESIALTARRRPDLIGSAALSARERRFANQIIKGNNDTDEGG